MFMKTLLVLRQAGQELGGPWHLALSLHLLPGVSMTLSWETVLSDAAVPGGFA